MARPHASLLGSRVPGCGVYSGVLHPLPPRCAARYRLARLVGTGAHGAVYLATQLELDRPAAVKVLHPDVACDPEAVQRFEQEARLTASLTHPNVVRLIEHDLEDDPPWIAYEYLEGLTLHQVVQKGPLPWREAVRATLQIASALEAAHGAGMLHRDIKPSNVIQAGPDEYKLTDFGLARLIADHAKVTRTGCVVGTPAYLAPEVMEGSDHTAAADLFAVGAMLYKLATGNLPPRHDLVVVAGHAQDPGLPRPSAAVAGLPPAVDRLVMGCSHRDPKSRFPSAGALRQAAEEALADPQRGVTVPAGARGGTARMERLDAGADRPLTRPFAPAASRGQARAWVLSGAVVLAVAATFALAARREQNAAWVDLPSPASAPPSAAARHPLPDRDRFAATLARVRHRWAGHTVIISLMNPLHPDIAAAAQRTLELLPGARADRDELTRMADALADDYRDPDTTPLEAAVWLARTASARFTAWAYAEVLAHTNQSANLLLTNGNDTMADAHDMLGSFAAIDLSHDGLVLIRRYHAAVLPVFRAMCLYPDRPGPETFDLLFDAREIARMRGMARWQRRDDDELRKLVSQFKADIGGLPGPAGRALSHLIARFWDWGDPAGRVHMTRASYEEALADVDALAALMPAAREAIQRLGNHMRTEMQSFPPAPRPH